MARKKRSGVEELTKVFSEILRVSKQYSYLWDEGYVEGNSIGLAWGWIAQDETFSIDVGKYKGKFKIGGKNFAYNYRHESNLGLGAKEAAQKIVKHWSGYNIKAEKLKEHFYSGLEKPLGKYLARKELSDKL